MDKRKEANTRVKERITAALLQLLGKKRISEISVSEITTSADVSRSSFYRNYSTKESVISTCIADWMTQLQECLLCDGESFYCYENVRRSFAFFSRNANQILDMYRFGYGTLLLEMLNQLHEDVAGTMPCRSIERYQLYIYIGSLYNTAMMWLRSGQKESIEEVSDMFYDTCFRRTFRELSEGCGQSATNYISNRGCPDVK